jgi:hypothetical protein
MKKCFECGEEANHEHHVVPKSLGGTKTVLLCETHHGLIHDLNFLNHKELIVNKLKENKNNNKKYTKIAPYGYKWKGDKMFINKNEQKIINIILSLKDKLSTVKIAKYLNDEDIQGRNKKPFSQMLVWKIIKRAKDDEKDTMR